MHPKEAFMYNNYNYEIEKKKIEDKMRLIEEQFEMNNRMQDESLTLKMMKIRLDTCIMQNKLAQTNTTFRSNIVQQRPVYTMNNNQFYYNMQSNGEPQFKGHDRGLYRKDNSDEKFKIIYDQIKQLFEHLCSKTYLSPQEQRDFEICKDILDAFDIKKTMRDNTKSLIDKANAINKAEKLLGKYLPKYCYIRNF